MICVCFYNQPYLVEIKKEKLWKLFSELKVTDFQNKILTVETVLLDTTANVYKPRYTKEHFTQGWR